MVCWNGMLLQLNKYQSDVCNTLMHACLVMSALCDPMDCSLPGSTVHGIFQTGILILKSVLNFYNISSEHQYEDKSTSCTSLIWHRQTWYTWKNI